MIVKICGLTRNEDIAPAVDAGATHLGMIFAARSPRCISVEDAVRLRRAMPADITPVGVFKNQSPDEVLHIARTVGLQWVQLHGGFTHEAIRTLHDAGLHVIWAAPVSSDGQYDALPRDADILLLDTAAKGQFGGSGSAFAWADTVRPEQRFLIAGGITPANVQQAIDTLAPDGVDMCSGVESTAGIKSHGLLRDLGIALRATASPSTIAHAESTASSERISMTTTASKGRFGDFGGQYIPETLHAPLAALEAAWTDAMASEAFRNRLTDALKNYVGRPSPITRAPRLEAAWNAKGPIYFKREDLNHTGAHKINNSLGQGLLAQRMGCSHVIAETGAGQHGVATATVCAWLGLQCTVFMGELDMERQALNVYRMRLLGADVQPVTSGTRTLKDAVNESMRTWVTDPENIFYCLGSALGPYPYPNIVRGFQEVIGKEARAQYLEAEGHLPSAVVACVGGGSNAIGIFSAFLDDKDVALYGGEAGGDGVETGRHAARFSTGLQGVLHGTRTYVLQDENGQVLPTHSISAGLDYAAVGPEHAHLRHIQRAHYAPVTDTQALDAFYQATRLEGLMPALESAHAIALAKQLIDDDIPHTHGILINMSGRGDKDVHTLAQNDHSEVDA